MTITITAHKMHVHGYVQLADYDLFSIEFPFPLQTELGIPIKTETGKDISVDGYVEDIPIIGGVISPPMLHVIIED